jgi:hypothetical protein
MDENHIRDICLLFAGIFWDDELVFYHDYIGGTVRNKYFKTKII